MAFDGSGKYDATYNRKEEKMAAQHIMGTTDENSGMQGGAIQERVERTYHDKSKTKIKAETPYRDGKIDGALKTYYEDGKLKSETIYARGKKQGTDRTCYEDGTVKSETLYENGKKNGPEREYNNEGILISETHWKDGLYDGFDLSCCYGTISNRYQYTGKETVYHWIASLSHYKNDKKDGLEEASVWGILYRRIIHKKGVRIRSTAYKDGMKQGKEIWCDEYGKPIRIVVYEKGVVTGIKGKDVSKLGPEYDYHSYPNEKYKSTVPFKNGVVLAHYAYHSGMESASGGQLLNFS
jgi:antitoxin component YwqK of YwqJK toxin-antitoxin module